MKQHSWLPKIDDCPPSLLHTFVAFAETGSVSQAAQLLGLEQPLVSRRLKAFLGDAGGWEGLLERTGPRGLQVTDRGRALLPQIREVLTRYEELLGHLRGQQETVEVVRLGLGSFAAQFYLPAVLVEAERQKRWRLETRVIRGRTRILSVTEGHLDLALVTHGMGDIAILSSGPIRLTTTLLAQYPLRVLAHPATRAGQELTQWPTDRALTPNQLADWPLVGLDEQSGLHRKLLREMSGQASLYLAHGRQPGGWALGREYARHQLGVALLPSPLVTRQDLQDFVVRTLNARVVLEVFLVARGETPSSALTEVIQLFHAVAQSQTGSLP